MVFDFTKPITGYEALALMLAIFALLLPLIKSAYHRWILKAKLKYLPLGYITLMFNESGSYVRLDGVFDVVDKSIAIKEVNLTIKRKIDERTLNLEWEAFISPVSQQFGNTYASVSEVAHPFRVDANSVACGFIEFADLFNTFTKQYKPLRENLRKELHGIAIDNQDSQKIYHTYYQLNSYKEAESLLKKELFWELGEYRINLTVKHSDGTDEFKYEFEIGSGEYKDIKHNFCETLNLSIKNYLNQKIEYKTVSIKLKEVSKR